MSIEKCINMSDQYRLHFEIKKMNTVQKKETHDPFYFSKCKINLLKVSFKF